MTVYKNYKADFFSKPGIRKVKKFFFDNAKADEFAA
jgi:hypothetical protein